MRDKYPQLWNKYPHICTESFCGILKVPEANQLHTKDSQAIKHFTEFAPYSEK